MLLHLFGLLLPYTQVQEYDSHLSPQKIVHAHNRAKGDILQHCFCTYIHSYTCSALIKARLHDIKLMLGTLRDENYIICRKLLS